MFFFFFFFFFLLSFKLGTDEKKFEQVTVARVGEFKRGGWEANLYKRRKSGLQAKGREKEKNEELGKFEERDPFLSKEQNLRENDVQKPSPSSRKRTVKSGGCNGRSEALSQGLSWLSMQPDRRTTSGQMDDFITFFLFFPFSFSPFFFSQIIDRPFFYISPFFLNLVTLAEAWSVKRLGRGWIGRRR